MLWFCLNSFVIVEGRFRYKYIFLNTHEQIGIGQSLVMGKDNQNAIFLPSKKKCYISSHSEVSMVLTMIG